uniref:Uncharacterized protein n=1 Tax=Ascaris lumbricoides TaxID=6252 RepID=A0A0M3IPR5_ASCLU
MQRNRPLRCHYPHLRSCFVVRLFDPVSNPSCPDIHRSVHLSGPSPRGPSSR